MTRGFKFGLIALAAFALCAATAQTASAWRGSNGGGGSWGGNGSNGGSWGRNGSNGSNGSFGGLFSRRRGGSWGSNGSHGSNGGNGSCGSHGGTYQGEVYEESAPSAPSEADSDKQARSNSQRETRYYGTREYRGNQTRQPAPGAPVINEPAPPSTINAPQNQGSSTPQQSSAVENPSAHAAPPIRSGEAAKP
jgi:hypothetical protein